MTRKIIPYIILLICIGAISCKKDFLDVDNTTFVNRQEYVKDLNTLGQFTNGIYFMLAKDFEECNASAYPEVVSDNLKAVATFLLPHYGWVQKANNVDNGSSIVAANVSMNPYWKTGYTIARACSFVLENADKYRNQGGDKADDLKGQALALRAYVYFKLINTFAQTYKFSADASHPGIPYVTSSDITISFNRITVGEVYTNIIKDLTNANELLAAAVTDTRTINRNAVSALLARVYLFMEDYTQAKELAMEIANKCPLMTVTAGYPADIYKLKAPAQTESLFQLTPSTTGFTTIFLNTYLRKSPIRYVATNDIATILKENVKDVRQAWVTNVSGQWNVVKFPTNAAPEVVPALTTPELAYYPVIIRSSEMFLTVAESAAKTGDENTARTYLDAIRKRADPTMLPVTATGQALKDSIYKERRKEFAFESLRMYDLQRWKLGVHRVDVVNGYPKDLPFESANAIAPIPVTDVNLGGIPQNLGY